MEPSIIIMMIEGGIEVQGCHRMNMQGLQQGLILLNCADTPKMANLSRTKERLTSDTATFVGRMEKLSLHSEFAISARCLSVKLLGAEMKAHVFIEQQLLLMMPVDKNGAVFEIRS